MLRAHEPDRSKQAGWSEVLEEATTGEIAFAGGALRMSLTPAMTLFDVDGDGAARCARDRRRARPWRAAIVRHGIGGSIGIDFPTLANKAQRQAVAEAIDAALPQPFERTAVNGFGFLQIVRRRRRASLPELLARRSASAPRRAPSCAGSSAFRRRCPLPICVRRRTAARDSPRSPTGRAELARRTGGAMQFERRMMHGQARRLPDLRQAHRSGDFKPFCSRGCKDRDLLQWLGEGYRMPGDADRSDARSG